MLCGGFRPYCRCIRNATDDASGAPDDDDDDDDDSIDDNGFTAVTSTVVVVVLVAWKDSDKIQTQRKEQNETELDAVTRILFLMVGPIVIVEGLGFLVVVDVRDGS